MAKCDASSLRSQSVTLDIGSGKHRKYLPYVFTGQGVTMLSAVLWNARF
ncbi:MAG: ORF6N domain-containing protein [Candidatus Omnitrophica bacterium]|nr:ORF6N domain-containing protein [Candidatus Omnitrophota bacterium]